MAIFASAILLGSTVVAFSPANREAFAHTFKGNENVAFLTMVQQVKVETSLAGNNTSTNKDIANHHIEHATEALTNATLEEISERNKRIATDLPIAIEQLKASINAGNATADDIKQQVQGISDLLDEAVQVRIERNQVTNSTVQALVVANLVNEVLEHYGEVTGIKGNDTGMSSSFVMGEQNSTSTSGSEGGHLHAGGEVSGQTTATSSNDLVSEANYQSAQAFAEKANELYQQIRAQAVPGKDSAVKALDNAFAAFVRAIQEKASLAEVTNLAHLRIHPNLMEAYGLKLQA
jgi:hypothetical protein